MKIAIVGGHGQIARRLTALLTERDHEVVGVIRNPAHASELRSWGAEPCVIDLETASLDEVAHVLDGCDAAVFAAGAGPGSGAERKITMDRDGAMLTADACERMGVRRLVVISAIGADSAEHGSDDVFQVYLRAKAEADAYLRSRGGLEYTIVRPATLTDEAGRGTVEAGEGLEAAPISRDDVAEAVCVLLDERLAVRRQLDLTGGATPIAEALRGLEAGTARPLG